MNKLYTEGLLDAEYFTQTADQFKAKLAQGFVAFQGCKERGLERYLEINQIAYDRRKA